MKLFNVRYRTNGYYCFADCSTWNEAVETADFLLKNGIATKAIVQFRDKYGNHFEREFNLDDKRCLNGYI